VWGRTPKNISDKLNTAAVEAMADRGALAARSDGGEWQTPEALAAL
jgi:hypothetical protein